jgi:hypothetical protein
MKGFAQFGGRVVEIVFGRNHAPDDRGSHRDRRAAGIVSPCSSVRTAAST